MVARRLNLASMTTNGAPGTGAVTLLAAYGNYQTFAAAATNAGVALAINDVVWVKAVDGAAWEIWPATVTNATGPVLSAPDSAVRGFQSSSGSVLSLSSAAIVSAEQPREDIAQVPATPGVRLSLVSGLAVMISDQTAKTAIYVVPVNGGVVPIFNGVSWISYVIDQLTLTLDTSNHLTPFVYDVCLWNNAGVISVGAIVWNYAATVTMTIATPAVVTWTAHGLAEGDPVVFTNSGGALPTNITAGTVYYVGRSPAANTFNVSTSVANASAGTFIATSGSQSGTHTGTNRTRQRGTGAGTPELQLVNGLPTNKNSVTLTNGAGGGTSGIAANTALLVGAFQATANGQTGMAFIPAVASGGTANALALFNAFNQVTVRALVRDSVNNWTVANQSWAPANASVSDRCSFLDGLQQSQIDATYKQYCTPVNGKNVRNGMSLNSTVATPQVQGRSSGSGIQSDLVATDCWPPSLGVSYVQMQQISDDASNTALFLGTTNPLNGMVVQLAM